MQKERLMRIWIWVYLCACLGLMPAAKGWTIETAVEEASYSSAMLLFNQQHWDEAQEKFAEFQLQFPKSRWHWAVQLRLADLESEPERAEKLYTEIIRQAEQTEWAWEARWGLANNEYGLAQYETALKQFRFIAQSRGSRKIRAMYYVGLCYLAMKNLPAAFDAFNGIAAQYPNSALAGAALAGMGDVEQERNNPEAARRYYAQYMKNYPSGELSSQVLEKQKNLNQPDTARQTPKNAGNLEAPAALHKKKGDQEIGNEKYCVQVGAFSKPEYAQILVRKLKSKGFSAYSLEVKTTDSVFHQVRVGCYNQRQLAEQISTQLTKKEALPALIVPFVAQGENAGNHGKPKPSKL